MYNLTLTFNQYVDQTPPSFNIRYYINGEPQNSYGTVTGAENITKYGLLSIKSLSSDDLDNYVELAFDTEENKTKFIIEYL